jgi:hypothetical protein
MDPMSRQIKIDDDVFEALRREAVPFQDHEPNDVLRRLLLGGDRPRSITTPTERATSKGVGTARRVDKPSRRKRAPSSSLMPETEYRYPILHVLSDNGGRLPTSEAVAAVGEIVRDKLLPADREKLGKKPRWQARIQFARLRLIEEGLMNKNSPRGVWEISAEGEKLVQGKLRSDAISTVETTRKMAGAR